MYSKALDVYNDLNKRPNYDLNIHTYKACCLYALAKYKEAFDESKLGLENDLNIRVKFHIAFKLGNGTQVIDNHAKLNKNNIVDKLCLAASQYLKTDYEDAIEVYKKILLDKKYDAVNIYLAMCYYKVEYWEVAKDLVIQYLSRHKSSVIVTNLKAAIEYNMSGNQREAISVLSSLSELPKNIKILEENELLKHNMAVFDNEDNPNKLRIFSSLMEVIPEAKLNLIIYYLRSDQIASAYNLIKDIQPTQNREYILKATTHCLLGQQSDKNAEHIKKAMTYFQSIGASASECDTIEGRICMAACFRLNKLYNDELLYLESIENFMKDDDDFNWNYGISLAVCQKYKEAEEVLLRIKKEKYKNEITYLYWISRVYIMNGKPDYAWNLYISIENHLIALSMLNFITNEFYRMGHFYYALKAFVFMEKFSPSQEILNGKTASAIGVFYQLIAGKIGSERLIEVIQYLSQSTQTEDVKKSIKIFEKWGKENGYNFSSTNTDDLNY